MEKRVKRTPLCWQIPGYFFGTPLVFILFFFARNEYFLPKPWRWLFLAVALVAPLTYRMITKRPGHTLLFVMLTLMVYNWPFAVGGFLFLGWWTGVALVLSALAGLLIFKTSWFVRIGFSCIVFCIVGLVAVYVEREFGEDRCTGEATKRSPVFKTISSRQHAYDFEKVLDPPRIVATFGLDSKIVSYDPTGRVAPSVSRLRNNGVQRLTLHPDGRSLLATYWGKWEDDEVLEIISPHNGERLRSFHSPGCRNAFETVADEERGAFYMLCEVSHNILKYSFDSDTPDAVLELPGVNSYDLLIDRAQKRLYVSDWLSPFLFVVDLDSFSLQERIWIGWTAFGLVEGPRGRIYVARPLASEIVVVSQKSLQVESRIDVGYGIRDLDVDLKRGLLFAGNYFDGTLDIIDLKTQKRITQYYAGRLLRGLYFDSDMDTLYLATGCGVLKADVAKLLSP